MKKVMYLVFLLAVTLMIPTFVFADDEASSDDKEAILYFFRGEGCSHCAEAEEWFKSIEEEYGSKFKIVDYETWYDEDNANLMKKVAEARGEEDKATGVPYIIIGDKSWIGFADEYKDEIKDQINSVYDQEVSERYDIIKLVGDSGSSSKASKKKSSGDVVALIVILLACGGIGFGIYKARQNTN